MHNIVFDYVSKSYGSKEVIKDLNFEIKEGERVIFLGPSGCGKSTTLRMIAGFEDITSGKLSMGGKVINDVAPGLRNIAMVFQSYALFPHMNVWDNITFGLKIQKLPETEIKKRADEALEMLHLQGYEKRPVRSLSGGQKQRVALCRAIVKYSPYFLLDEPLSNLDAQLRQRARQELVKIHEVNHSTMIYVTHDQVEAMTVGQRIAVLHDGTLQQIATPNEIYHNPANTFVASFIGSPAMNLVNGTIADGALVIGKTKIALPKDIAFRLPQGAITIGIRPENVKLVSDDQALIKGACQYTENTGNLQTILLHLEDGTRFFVQATGEQYDTTVGENLGLSFTWTDVCFFDAKTGKNLYIHEEGGKA